MAVTKLVLAKNIDVLISRVCLEKLLDNKDGNIVRLYLYILSCDGILDANAAATRLSLSLDQVSAALDVLTRIDLVHSEEKPCLLERPDTIPEYTVGDVTSTLEKDSSFRYLLEFTQKRLGKVLSTVDTQTLLGIYSWMGLPVEVICLLITCSIDEIQKKYGEGRRPTMRNIENRARLWLNLGIQTQAQAEEYLHEQEQRGTRQAQLVRLLHLSGRPLSPTENRYISDWIDAGFSDELILEAYDITVVKTGGLKWKYMNSILKSWQLKGYRRSADIEEGERKVRQKEQRMDEQELDAMRRLREINREWGSE